MILAVVHPASAKQETYWIVPLLFLQQPSFTFLKPKKVAILQNVINMFGAALETNKKMIASSKTSKAISNGQISNFFITLFGWRVKDMSF